VKVLLSQFRKPASETRFYDRIGKSLIWIDGAEIVSAGANIPAGKEDSFKRVSLQPVFKAGTSITTIFQNLARLTELIKRENPDIFIFCNPELALLLPYLRVVLPGMKVIFDLQENHRLNFLKQKHLPLGGKMPALAADFLVRLCCRFSHRIWLAEKIYRAQMPVPASKSVCLENKPGHNMVMKHPSMFDPHLFSFTGFVSRESGILRAIRFVLQLRTHHPQYRLIVCGYCPDKALIKEILRYPFISYASPESWVSQETILSCLASSCGMLMPYVETDANAGKTPSKWFLARAAGIPVLYDAKTSLQLPDQSSVGFAVDFENPENSFITEWKKFRDDFRPLAPSPEHYFPDGIVRDEIIRLSGMSSS
jgi:glycosyltransferase involved in cell wall biosynthesis